MKNNLMIGIIISLFLILIFVFLFAINDVLAPFIFSFVIAYIINPAVKKLEKIGFSKLISVCIMMISIILMGVILVVLVVPLAYYQSINFIGKIPEYIDSIHSLYNFYIPEINKFIPKEEIHRLGMNISTNIVENISEIISNLWTSGMFILTTVFFLFLTPIILFHASYQWENVINELKKLIPFRYSNVIFKEVKNIDNAISGYIRGQTLVCIVAAVYYMVAFTSLKLNHGVFIGLISGILTFIPYVGSTFCLIVSHLVAFTQFDNMYDILKITIAFFIEQIIEVAFLAPNLIGNKIKLHPLWVMFSIFAGGALLGFVGVLIALPIAAIIGVLVRFALQKYLSTDFYAGRTITSDK